MVCACSVLREAWLTVVTVCMHIHVEVEVSGSRSFWGPMCNACVDGGKSRRFQVLQLRRWHRASTDHVDSFHVVGDGKGKQTTLVHTYSGGGWLPLPRCCRLAPPPPPSCFWVHECVGFRVTHSLLRSPPLPLDSVGPFILIFCLPDARDAIVVRVNARHTAAVLHALHRPLCLLGHILLVRGGGYHRGPAVRPYCWCRRHRTGAAAVAFCGSGDSFTSFSRFLCFGDGTAVGVELVLSVSLLVLLLLMTMVARKDTTTCFVAAAVAVVL